MSEIDKNIQERKEDEELLRDYRLVTAWGDSEPVLIDGVTFIFDCAIDSSIWRPICPLGYYNHRGANYGPEIAFPWTPDAWRNARAEGAQIIEASEGSVVFVRAITSAPISTPFAEFQALELRQIKLLYFSVRQNSGEILSAHSPLILLSASATEALIGVGDYTEAFQSMIGKLERVTGTEDIEDKLDDRETDWPKLKDGVLQPYVQAFWALEEARGLFDEKAAYAAFGYMMAKAEAEAELLQPALRGRQAESFQAKAADRRHVKSREATEKLRTIAQKIIELDPQISLSRCARLVEDEVTKDKEWPFKSDAKWIARHIRELFEKRGSRGEYRPKRL